MLNNKSEFIIKDILDNIIKQIEVNDKLFIKEIPNQLIQNEISKECPICFEHLKDDHLILFECLHKYHYRCILQTDQNICSLCGSNKYMIIENSINYKTPQIPSIKKKQKSKLKNQCKIC